MKELRTTNPRLNEIQLSAIFAERSYDEKKPIPESWHLAEQTDRSLHDKYGFKAEGYANDNEKLFMIAIRGALPSKYQSFVDGVRAVIQDKPPKALPYAIAFADEIEKKYQGYDIRVTGYSLGGTCSEHIGLIKGWISISLDSPGIDSLSIEQYGLENPNWNKIYKYHSTPNYINAQNNQCLGHNFRIPPNKRLRESEYVYNQRVEHLEDGVMIDFWPQMTQLTVSHSIQGIRQSVDELVEKANNQTGLERINRFYGREAMAATTPGFLNYELNIDQLITSSLSSKAANYQKPLEFSFSPKIFQINEAQAHQYAEELIQAQLPVSFSDKLNQLLQNSNLLITPNSIQITIPAADPVTALLAVIVSSVLIFKGVLIRKIEHINNNLEHSYGDAFNTQCNIKKIEDTITSIKTLETNSEKIKLIRTIVQTIDGEIKAIGNDSSGRINDIKERIANLDTFGKKFFLGIKDLLKKAKNKDIKKARDQFNKYLDLLKADKVDLQFKKINLFAHEALLMNKPEKCLELLEGASNDNSYTALLRFNSYLKLNRDQDAKKCVPNLADEGKAIANSILLEKEKAAKLQQSMDEYYLADKKLTENNYAECDIDDAISKIDNILSQEIDANLAGQLCIIKARLYSKANKQDLAIRYYQEAQEKYAEYVKTNSEEAKTIDVLEHSTHELATIYIEQEDIDSAIIEMRKIADMSEVNNARLVQLIEYADIKKLFDEVRILQSENLEETSVENLELILDKLSQANVIYPANEKILEQFDAVIAILVNKGAYRKAIMCLGKINEVSHLKYYGDSLDGSIECLKSIYELLNVDANSKQFDVEFKKLADFDFSSNENILNLTRRLIYTCIQQQKFSPQSSDVICQHLKKLFSNNLEQAEQQLTNGQALYSNVRVCLNLLYSMTFMARLGNLLSAAEIQEYFHHMDELVQKVHFDDARELACIRAKLKISMNKPYAAKQLLEELDVRNLSPKSKQAVEEMVNITDRAIAKFQTDVLEVIQLFFSYAFYFADQSNSNTYLILDSIIEVYSRYNLFCSFAPDKKDASIIPVFIVGSLLLLDNLFRSDQYKTDIGVTTAQVMLLASYVLGHMYYNYRNSEEKVFSFFSLAKFGPIQKIMLARHALGIIVNCIGMYERSCYERGELIPEGYMVAVTKALATNKKLNFLASAYVIMEVIPGASSTIIALAVSCPVVIAAIFVGGVWLAWDLRCESFKYYINSVVTNIDTSIKQGKYYEARVRLDAIRKDRHAKYIYYYSEEARKFLQQLENRQASFYCDIFFRLIETVAVNVFRVNSTDTYKNNELLSIPIFRNFCKKICDQVVTDSISKYQYESLLLVSTFHESILYLFAYNSYCINLDSSECIFYDLFKSDPSFVFRLINNFINYALRKHDKFKDHKKILLKIHTLLTSGFMLYGIYAYSTSNGKENHSALFNGLYFLNFSYLNFVYISEIITSIAYITLPDKITLRDKISCAAFLAKKLNRLIPLNKTPLYASCAITATQIICRYPDILNILYQTDYIYYPIRYTISFMSNTMQYAASPIENLFDIFSLLSETCGALSEMGSYLLVSLLGLINAIMAHNMVPVGVVVCFVSYIIWQIIFSEKLDKEVKKSWNEEISYELLRQNSDIIFQESRPNNYEQKSSRAMRFHLKAQDHSTSRSIGVFARESQIDFSGHNVSCFDKYC